jgi:mono/diheme cytochrome c family protein
MLKRAAIVVVFLAIVGAALAWLLTAPEPLQAAGLPQHTPDAANGERIFYAAGCASCHAAPEAKGEDKLKLAGGLELKTPFGLFRVPNISPDPDTGIGGWSTLDFVNAVTLGVSPGGAHYYPAFPYASYIRMRVEDVIDLKAFLDALPAVSNQVAGHELGFPYNVRRGVGLWKRLYLSDAPVLDLADASEAARRGQYLVEGPGHCGECHTSRDSMGGLKPELWLAGAPNPEGRGTIPNITPHEEGIAGWSESELADLFKTGFTPDFDTLGGSMAAVQQELSHLPDEDLQAIVAYLKAVPPLPDAVQRAPPAEGGDVGEATGGDDSAPAN